MNNDIEYAVYGIIEPYTNKIVYIDYYIYDWSNRNEYPDKEEIIKDTIQEMKWNNNKYWRDLYNMYYYNINYEDSNKILTGVVVLESFYEGEKDPRKEIDYYINIFKPRYNINDCRNNK